MRGSGERRLSPSVCSFDGETTMKWRERESVAVWAEEEDDERERETCEKEKENTIVPCSFMG